MASSGVTSVPVQDGLKVRVRQVGSPFFVKHLGSDNQLPLPIQISSPSRYTAPKSDCQRRKTLINSGLGESQTNTHLPCISYHLPPDARRGRPTGYVSLLISDWCIYYLTIRMFHAMKKVDARRLPPAQQQELRRRVVSSVVDDRMSQVEASRVYGVARPTISGWIKRFRREGDAGLASRRRGPRTRGRLSRDQEREVEGWIFERCPDRLKLRFALWSRVALQELLAKRYDVRVSLSTVGRYLKRWGISPQCPRQRLLQHNPEIMGRWLEDEYLQVVAQAKKEDATIWWAAIEEKPYHQRVISATTNRRHTCFQVRRGYMDGGVLVDFLQRLRRQTKRKVLLIIQADSPLLASGAQELEESAEFRLVLLPDFGPSDTQDQEESVTGPDRSRGNDVPQRVEKVRWRRGRRRWP
jgi:transposase